MLMSLLTLTALEIVLGIDNLLFISILSQRLPEEKQLKARRIGLFAALGTRLLLLSLLFWIAKLTQPLFTIASFSLSWRDIILIAGGFFLIYKATVEIYSEIEDKESQQASKQSRSFSFVITQIAIIDIVFSLDSIITAVGIANDLPVMILAIILAVLVMLFASEPLARFIHAHPSIKILALSFLLMVGMALVADGFGSHVPKGYLYTAMLFSTCVESINVYIRKKKKNKNPEN
jgi:predicted tellurium resistance membrane protein TerC